MDFGFIKEYFYIILIAITIPSYWLIIFILKKLNIQSRRIRAFIAFIITTIVVVVVGILLALKGFIMSHNIPGN